MSLTAVLIIVLVLLVLTVGVAPIWRQTASWGYGPSGGLGVVLVVVLILWLLGKL